MPADQTIDFRNGNGRLVERPFKGWISGAVPMPAEACAFGGAVAGELAGNLTHLGKTRVEYEGCVGFAAPEVTVRAAEDRFRVKVQGEYIAPPLDTIIIITDFFTFPDDDSNDSGNLEGTYTIMGGTGRFQEAKGQGVLWGRSTAHDRGMEVSLEFEGTVVY